MGLAAGLGIAALASWLGFGETLTMFLTVLLIGLALMLLVGFVMRRMRGPQPAVRHAAAGRGPGTYSHVGYETSPAPLRAVQRTASRRRWRARPGSAMDQFARGEARRGAVGHPGWLRHRAVPCARQGQLRSPAACVGQRQSR